MRMIRLSSTAAAATLLLVCIFVSNSLAGGECGRKEGLAALARECAGDDATKAREAITQLRSAGQDGLDALCAEQAALLLDLSQNPAGAPATGASAAAGSLAPTGGDPRIARLRHAIDAVARQRDAYASGLFWYTDLDQAMAQAKSSGKPILSLRLLGKLDDDLSCANSRFFRSVLYANAQVSDYLREHFILHWESLRPVPKLTIDFGDGRRIERTITGNSIHYILDSNGEIIDAIPGLYGPQAFLAAIKQGETAARAAMAMRDPMERGGFLRAYHQQSANHIVQAWEHDLRAGVSDAAIIAVASALAMPVAAAPAGARPDAMAAAPLAVAKSFGEVPVLNAMYVGELKDANRRAPSSVTGLERHLEELMTDDLWTKVASLHAGDAALDESSVALIRSKMPALETAEQAQRRTMSKREVEDPAMHVLGEFQRSIAADTVRNEYLFHRAIHNWLAAGTGAQDVAKFNQRVYAELFLTPLDDPWMGLAPRDAYAAVDGGGLIEACGK